MANEAKQQGISQSFYCQGIHAEVLDSDFIEDVAVI